MSDVTPHLKTLEAGQARPRRHQESQSVTRTHHRQISTTIVDSAQEGGGRAPAEASPPCTLQGSWLRLLTPICVFCSLHT
ncbi:hypothetical protein GDO81_001643 [Engystomops pustulosus]|uniref:Uncharacterized protein n=1 Tax=Engystomops pustulosus TaxID=76066 RepID=A0AAV7DGF7_ENGPU|nr:hypothetical protein GDO81_001643 [Engystomops pustulosus]